MAAAAELPPRFSQMDIYGTSTLANSALDSAQAMNPTGMPITRDGETSPSLIMSNRASRAVGALPTTAMAPSKWGVSSRIAATDLVVPSALARSAVFGVSIWQ